MSCFRTVSEQFSTEKKPSHRGVDVSLVFIDFSTLGPIGPVGLGTFCCCMFVKYSKNFSGKQTRC